MSEPTGQKPLEWRHHAQIAVPAPEHERRMAIREVDWARIRRAMQQVQRPLPNFSFIYSALIGAAASAGLTIIPLWFAQGLPAWVIPLYVVFTFFSGLVAISLYRVERGLAERQREDATGILRDMEDIERHFPAEPKVGGTS